MAGLNTERLILAAMQLGVAERSFADTLAFITERKQFGRPIGSFQVLRHRMAARMSRSVLSPAMS
ncbi:hypothetical protein A5777_05625 [Gordonia sp. 852002-10350_SCH5691597]|nr:hypothetical protein A5777_05625 [Gordonia sp. 852002-10350_SCH5691597]